MIKALLGNDKVAKHRVLTDLYQNYYPLIKAFVLKNNGTEEDALDVFQDGVIALYNSLEKGNFRNESSIQTYLYSICRNKWYSKYKKRSNEKRIEIIDQDEDIEILNEPLLDDVISQLKPECVAVLKAYYYKDQSMKEIMTLFELGSEQAAKNKKLRCLRYLMKIVKSRGLSYQNFILAP